MHSKDHEHPVNEETIMGPPGNDRRFVAAMLCLSILCHALAVLFVVMTPAVLSRPPERVVTVDLVSLARPPAPPPAKPEPRPQQPPAEPVPPRSSLKPPPVAEPGEKPPERKKNAAVPEEPAAPAPAPVPRPAPPAPARAFSSPEPSPAAASPSAAMPSPGPPRPASAPIASPGGENAGPGVPLGQPAAPAKASASSGAPGPASRVAAAQPGQGSRKAQGDDAGASRKYFSGVRSKIERNRVYPERARRLGIEGRVVVRFTIRTDGSVDELTIVKGSESEALDQAARDAVRRASPFAPPPESLASAGPITLDVPILFELQ